MFELNLEKDRQAGCAKEKLILKLVKQHGTPLFLIHTQVLQEQWHRLSQSLPGVRLFYATKALPHPIVLSEFARLGMGFDCASAGEIAQVLSNINDPQKIVYANPVKPKEHIQFAVSRGVGVFTADNFQEIVKLGKYAPGHQVVVRVDVGETNAEIPLSTKFGAAPSEVIGLLKDALEHELIPAGLSFHVGSQCTHKDAFVKGIRVTGQIAKEAKCHGLPIRIVDIGGGFPVVRSGEPYDYFEEIAQTIMAELPNNFDPSVQIYAEPGRFLVTAAVTLVLSVCGKARRNGEPRYYLDDGIYGTMSALLFDPATKFSFHTIKSGALQESKLFGPTCDSIDMIGENILLPELEVDDIIYCSNVGAYTLASATRFNGFNGPKVIQV